VSRPRLPRLMSKSRFTSRPGRLAGPRLAAPVNHEMQNHSIGSRTLRGTPRHKIGCPPDRRQPKIQVLRLGNAFERRIHMTKRARRGAALVLLFTLMVAPLSGCRSAGRAGSQVGHDVGTQMGRDSAKLGGAGAGGGAAVGGAGVGGLVVGNE
jgi:hypothetical protein